MNPQDPLANLHPLREPGAIGWWPPAPGWWLLAALLLAILALLVYFVLRRYRANRYRRQALLQLEVLHARFGQEGDQPGYLAGVNALLKSVALVAYPRRDIAASNGAAWLAFLNGSLKAGGEFPAEFVTATYRETAAAIDSEQLYRAASAWIKHHEAAR